jgi:hypothetical protein
MNTESVPENIMQRIRPWQRVSFVLLVVLVGTTGLWGFMDFHVDKNYGIWDAIPDTVRMFLQGVEYGQLEESNGRTLNVHLEIARIGSIFVLFWGGLLLAGGTLRSLSRYVFVVARGHHVVIIGFGTAGKFLTERLRRDGKRVLVIEKEPTPESRILCRRLGAYMIEGDGRDAYVLKMARIGKASETFVVTNSDSMGLQIVDQLHQFSDDPKQSRGRAKTQIYFFGRHPFTEEVAPIGDARLIHLLDLPALDLWTQMLEKSFRKCKNGIPVLPLKSNDERKLHVAVVGFDELGQSVVAQLALMAHFPNLTRAELTIIDPDVLIDKRAERDRLMGAFRGTMTNLHEVVDYEIWDRSFENQELQDKLIDAVRCSESLFSIVICGQSDDEAIRLAGVFVHRCKREGVPPPPVFVRALESEGYESAITKHTEKGKLLQNVHTFGGFRVRFNEFMERVRKREQLAKAFHCYFVAEFQGTDHSTTADDAAAAWKPFRELREDLKESNRLAAAHSRLKCMYAGTDPETESPSHDIFSNEVGLDERMARCEHNRWMAEKWLLGWQPGKKTDSSLKIQQNLIPWEQVPPDERAKDMSQIHRIPIIWEGYYKDFEDEASLIGWLRKQLAGGQD